MWGPFQWSLSVMNILLKFPVTQLVSPICVLIPGKPLRTLLLMFIGLLLECVIQSCGHVYPVAP